MKIYTNSYIDSEEITPTNFTEVIEDYADKLVEMAGDYRKLAKTIKKKNIKIVEAEGFAHGGCFRVDDIDTERLKKEGIVIDFAEKPSAENAVFYIDSELEQVIEESIEKLAEFDPDFEEMADTIMGRIYEEDEEDDFDEDHVYTAADFFGPVEDEDDAKQVNIDIKDLFPEEGEYVEFNLADKLIGSDGDQDFCPGDMAIEIKNVAEDAFVFNLKMADLGEPPNEVKYGRKEGIFEYKCSECDAPHFTNIDSVYRSLKIACSILSNMAEMTDYKELGEAINYIDVNLRLLQWLVALDYAIDDEGGA
jgi:hypothetical protein